jgi:hypothetical protein
MTDTSRDVQAYENFRGFAPREIVEEYLPDNDVSGWHMGDVNAIEYDTYRDDEKQYYRHEFKKNARPSLIAAEEGGQLYLTGGNYRVTERGIEDNKAMPALLIANPHKRGTKGKKVSSMFKRKRRRHNPVTVVSAPRKRRRAAANRRKSSPSAVVVRAPNPVKRLRRSRRRNPITYAKTRKVHHRRRRNPISIGGRGGLDIKALLLPALMQGSGAVATSIVASYLPLPDNLKHGSMAGATKAVIGIGLGWALAKFVNKKLGQNFAEGALTIAVYDAVKGAAANAGLPMAGMYEPSMGAMYQPSLGWTTASATMKDYGAAYA